MRSNLSIGTRMDFTQSIAGFFVGALVGLTGVGGGSLMTPLLVLLFGIHPATAVGTDLLYAAITKGAGTAVHSSQRNIDWRIAGLLAAGSVPAAGLTILLLSQLGIRTHAATGLISAVLGVALLLTAVSLFWRRRLLALAAQRKAMSPQHTDVATVITGIVLGTLVATSSVGAGAIGVTALLFLYPALGTSRIVGTDIAHAVPLTLVAGLGHWWLGDIDWTLLGSLLIGSLPGIWIGSHLSTRVPERALRPILATLLVVIGSKLIFQ
jgi:uncharacterized membrane protein YfcA